MVRPRLRYGYSVLLESYHLEHRTILYTRSRGVTTFEDKDAPIHIANDGAPLLSDLRKYEQACSPLLAPNFPSVEMLLINLVLRPMDLPGGQIW